MATGADAAIIGGHPRVWIDSTVKARLQADAAANTTEWQAMKTYCDSKLAANNGGKYQLSGYHSNDWYNFVLSYGLCFQATGNQTYGNEGVVYMKALLRDNSDGGVVGDGLGGDAEIRTDSGYVSRTLGTGVAIGRDWLDGATDLTPELISEATSRIATWWAWVEVSAHAITDARDNYFYGHLTMIYTTALSFYGDDGYLSTWLPAAETMWTSKVLPIINGGYYDGGDDAKGWNYSPWAFEEMVGYMLAMDTATDTPNPWADSNIYEDLAKSQIHFLYPNRGYFSDGGMWSADIVGDPRSRLSRFLAARTPLDATRKGTLKWFIDNLTYEPSQSLPWQKFLNKTSDITSVTPTVANMGGLSYTTNIGHLVARSDSDWSNADASYVEFFAYTDRLAGSTGGTNGDYAIGDMRFFNRGLSLIGDGDREQYTGHYNNQLLVTGSHTYAPYQESWLYTKSGVPTYPTVSIKTSEGQGYVYGKIVNAQNAYDGTYWTNTPSLAHYDRSMLTIWPDTVIVYDNATAKAVSNDVSVRWWFPREPTISGNTLTTTNAKADLKVSVLGLAGGFATPGTSYSLMAVTNTTTYRAGYYYSDFQTTGAPINNQMFTVQQATAPGVSAPSISEVAGTGGKGVLVGGADVAMFTDNQTGGTISTLAYIVDATRHFVADLPANTTFAVTRDGVAVAGSPFSSGTAGIISFSTASGSATYSVGGGTYTPPAPDCSADHLELCTDAATCTAVGGNYCSGGCQLAACPAVYTCSPTTLVYCIVTDCALVGGGFWYNNVCNATAQIDPPPAGSKKSIRLSGNSKSLRVGGKELTID